MHSIDLILALTGGLAGVLVFGYSTQRAGLSPIVGYLLAASARRPTRSTTSANASVPSCRR